jgi:itaconate CoA-transferase
MTFDPIYQGKLLSPDSAARLIPSGTGIVMGMALAEPPALLSAMSGLLDRGELADIRLYYFHSTPHAAATVLRYEVMDRVKPVCFFLGAAERALMDRASKDARQVVSYMPCAFSEAPRLMEGIAGLDTVIAVASPMDAHGYFTLGTSNDYTFPMAQRAKRVILEVNRHMPRVRGSAIHISEVTAVVENHQPLLVGPAKTPVEQDLTIAKLIAGHIQDGACLQVGIGSLPEAVCDAIHDRRHLGIHTELLSPGLVKLIRSGAVTNQRKAVGQGRSIFTFAVGDADLFDFIDDNPGVDSRPVNHVNNPSVIARNPQVVSVNAALQIDLSGACNAEHLSGRQYSGSGGQLDFVRGANASHGGKSFIACHSTAKDGTLSRLVGRLDGPVTTPRNDTHFVATEFGCVDLKGMSIDNRAKAIIQLAHPSFRGALTLEARHLGLI